jgi:RNA recognition motif-containing protein
MAKVTTLYVSNLASSVPEDILKLLFSQFGEIVKCVIVKHPYTGEPRGFAFVEYRDRVACETALQEYNETEFCGQKLSVVLAKPPDQETTRKKPANWNRHSSSSNPSTPPAAVNWNNPSPAPSHPITTTWEAPPTKRPKTKSVTTVSTSNNTTTWVATPQQSTAMNSVNVNLSASKSARKNKRVRTSMSYPYSNYQQSWNPNISSNWNPQAVPNWSGSWASTGNPYGSNPWASSGNPWNAYPTAIGAASWNTANTQSGTSQPNWSQYSNYYAASANPSSTIPSTVGSTYNQAVAYSNYYYGQPSAGSTGQSNSKSYYS